MLKNTQYKVEKLGEFTNYLVVTFRNNKEVKNILTRNITGKECIYVLTGYNEETKEFTVYGGQSSAGIERCFGKHSNTIDNDWSTGYCLILDEDAKKYLSYFENLIIDSFNPKVVKIQNAQHNKSDVRGTDAGKQLIDEFKEYINDHNQLVSIFINTDDSIDEEVEEAQETIKLAEKLTASDDELAEGIFARIDEAINEYRVYWSNRRRCTYSKLTTGNKEVKMRIQLAPSKNIIRIKASTDSNGQVDSTYKYESGAYDFLKEVNDKNKFSLCEFDKKNVYIGEEIIVNDIKNLSNQDLECIKKTFYDIYEAVK